MLYSHTRKHIGVLYGFGDNCWSGLDPCQHPDAAPSFICSTLTYLLCCVVCQPFCDMFEHVSNTFCDRHRWYQMDNAVLQ